MLVILGGSLLLGFTDVAMLASLGAFVVLYGTDATAEYRIKLLTTVALSLTASATVGAVVGPIAWLWVISLATTAALATFVCIALQVGPPGAFFIVLVQGVAGAAAIAGTTPVTVLMAVGTGSAIAVLIGMIDLLWDFKGPQRRAVAAADRAVRAYEEKCESQRDHGEFHPDAEGWDDLLKARHKASAAVHQAWTAVTDGDPLEWVDELTAIQDRYLAENTRALAHYTGLDGGPFEDVDGDGIVTALDEQLTASDRATRRQARRVATEQIRDTALGRPSPVRLLVRATRKFSEERLISQRVFLGTLLAGYVALLFGSDHVYWAAAFTSLLLNRGGTRDAQLVRALQRLVGTAVGLGVFAFLHWLDLSGWALVAVIVVLQGTVELLVVRNYAIAVVFITPLALTLAERAVNATGTGILILDRGLDTVIAAVFVFAMLFLVGRNRRIPMLRRYARTVVEAIEEVLVDIAANRPATAKGREHRKMLYYALLQSHEVAGYALADEPEAAAEYEQMEQTLNDLGYLVLSMAWHPDLRNARDLAAAARDPLDRIEMHPVEGGRPASEIHDDVRDLQALIQHWRPDRSI